MLKEKLKKDMKQTMIDGNKNILEGIRLVNASIKNEEIKKKRDLTDDEIIEIIKKEIKQIKESLSYMSHGVEENVRLTELQNRHDYLFDYLPEQLTEKEIKTLVQNISVQYSIDTGKMMTKKEKGIMMKQLMPQVKGKADGSLVNKVVEAHFAVQE